MTERNEIANDVRLDLYSLETEVQRQASLYLHYSQLASEARADRDRAVRRHDTRMAEKELDLRANPPGGKITEAGVKAYMEADPELGDLYETVITTNRDLSLLEGVCRALDHKKAQLDNAVRLWSAGYYQDKDRSAATSNGAAQMRSHLNRNNRPDGEG